MSPNKSRPSINIRRQSSVKLDLLSISNMLLKDKPVHANSNAENESPPNLMMNSKSNTTPEGFNPLFMKDNQSNKQDHQELSFDVIPLKCIEEDNSNYSVEDNSFISINPLKMSQTAHKPKQEFSDKNKAKFFNARESKNLLKIKSSFSKYRPDQQKRLFVNKYSSRQPSNNAYYEELPKKNLQSSFYKNDNSKVFSNGSHCLSKQVKKSRTNRSLSKEYLKFKKLDSSLRSIHKSLYDFRQNMKVSFKDIKKSKVYSLTV